MIAYTDVFTVVDNDDAIIITTKDETLRKY